MRDAGGTRELMSARAGTAPAGIDPRGPRERSAGAALQPHRGRAAPAPARVWERDTGGFSRSNAGTQL